uniref:DUF1985 domain-containing protein n=1 Tax=Solanum lycopersicum TaxID=4081 RepID=A0A3Q7IIR1_SOLLC
MHYVEGVGRQFCECNTFFYINGTTLRFTIREFAIISGLNCSDNGANFYFDTDQSNRIIDEYFPGNSPVTKARLAEAFKAKAFNELAKSINNKIKLCGQYYRIQGFPLPMQVWFYECCSYADDKIDVKVSSHIPRIINWVTKNDHPRFDYFMKIIFNDADNSEKKKQSVTVISINKSSTNAIKTYTQRSMARKAKRSQSININSVAKHSDAGQGRVR